jgi:hypothetical protein
VGDVYLVDFGSVQTLAARKGSTITVVGTYGYMPPEQFGGRNVAASDIYSLGATLIYLATGRHPAELSQDNVQIQFESIVNFNSDLIDWLKWMTQPSLNRRLASAGEALKALKNPRQQTDISPIRQKPFGSRIELKEDGENLEILIPPERLTFLRACVMLVFTLPCLGLVLLPFISIILVIQGGLQFINAFVMLFSFITLTLGGINFAILWGGGVIANCFRATQINIARNQISVTHLWPWYKCQVAPIMNKKFSKWSMYIRHSMAISGQEKYYKTLGIYQLTPPEIEWLANEISAFSGGKITVVSADNKYVKIPTAK